MTIVRLGRQRPDGRSYRPAAALVEEKAFPFQTWQNVFFDTRGVNEGRHTTATFLGWRTTHNAGRD
jgi:hypothetical protein